MAMRTSLLAIVVLFVLAGCSSGGGSQGNNGGGSGGDGNRNTASSDNPCDNLDKMDPAIRQNMQFSCGISKGTAEAGRIANGEASPEEIEDFSKRNQQQQAILGGQIAAQETQNSINQQEADRQTMEGARRAENDAWCAVNTPSGGCIGSP